jgi:hypothetical protein
MPVVMLAAMIQLNGAAGRYGAGLWTAGRSYLQPAARQVLQPGRGLTTPARTSLSPSISRTSGLLRPTAAPVFAGDNRFPIATRGPVCRSFSSSGKPSAFLGMSGLDMAAIAASVGLGYYQKDPALASIGLTYGLGIGAGRTYRENELREQFKGLIPNFELAVNREIDYELKLHSHELDNKIGMYKDQETAAKAELEKELNESTASLYTKASRIAGLAKRKEAALSVLANALARGEKNPVEQTVVSKISNELNDAQKAYETALQAYQAEKAGSRVQ